MLKDETRVPGTSQPEPNPKAGRRITEHFLDEQALYVEDLIAYGRAGYGTGCVLPSGSGQRMPLQLGPDGRIALNSLRAIGVFGHPIVVTEGDPGSAVTLDSTALPVGCHDVHACLAWKKTPFGPWEEERTSLDGGGTTRAYQYRKPSVALAVGDACKQYRDYIKVGVLHRERDHGTVGSHLDAAFHPFPADMRAYILPNPLLRLASDGLAALATCTGAGAPVQDASAALRRLQAVAECATPEHLFTLTQECAARMRVLSLEQLPLLLDGNLEDWRYDPATFCSFLATIAANLTLAQRELYPATLNIDDITFTRLPGELTIEGDTWVWSPPHPTFSANAFAIYFPRTGAAEVPHLQYFHSNKSVGHFEVARIARRLSHVGTAAVLDRLPPQCGKVHVIPDSDDQRVRLQQVLSHAHAIYKW